MFVLDSSALMQPIDFEDACTVPEVLDEVKNRPSRLRIESAISAGKLRVLEPSRENVSLIARASKSSGDALSAADVRLLALAKDTGSTVVTDDYGMQNVAKMLGLEFRPVSQRGIKKAIVWKRFCPGCKTYVSGIECPACGSKSVRKSR